MSEFRRDPITGRWRVVAEGRSARPNEYPFPPVSPTAEADCPFCEGHEARTPPEVAAVRGPTTEPDGPGWTVRAIPNRFPTVSSPSTPPVLESSRPFERAPAAGVHEVVIAGPQHSPDLGYLPPEHLRALFRLLRDRVRSLTDRPGIGAVLLFENRGPESGGTLPHPHLQLVATELVPFRLEEERAGFDRRTRPTTGRCLLESVVAAERAARERIVDDEGAFTAFAPFASEFPFELWLVPKRHATTFAEASDVEVDELATLLPRVLRGLDAISPRASYNWYVHGMRPRRGSVFHWHVELAPRLVRADGFELGAGTSVNPVAPEAAAEQFRDQFGRSAPAGSQKP
jgi:UDPglucose--hexose-1-phosphate uridylyltransferase